MLTDAQARQIACNWHNGAGSALYSLCSTGAISARTFAEVAEALAMGRHATPYLLAGEIDLAQLHSYITQKGERGSIKWWTALPWEEDDSVSPEDSGYDIDDDFPMSVEYDGLWGAPDDLVEDTAQWEAGYGEDW